MSIQLKTDCLDGAIGLSRTECDCITGMPANESLSNLWLDELPGLNLDMANAAADCSTGSVWDMLKKAREQGIQAFKIDYAAAIARGWKQSRIAFKGQIGKDKATKDYTIGAYAGLRFIFQPVRNGFYRITRVGAIFNTTGAIELNIYDNVSDTPLYTYDVPTVANKLTWYTLTTPIDLPMYSAQANYLQYFFLYAKPGFNPRDNNIHCAPCTGYTLGFGCDTPYPHNYTNDARLMFANWCNVTGVTGTGVDAIRDATTGFTDHAMGLVIDGGMSCQLNSIACNDTDFATSDIAIVKAYAIWYKAGWILADLILATNNINRYTLQSREWLYERKSAYKREYEQRIAWLTNPDVPQVKTELLQTGCLECIRRMGMVSTLR